MTPDLKLTIKANPDLHTHEAVMSYCDALITSHPLLGHYRYALVDVVNTRQDDQVSIYNEPDMDGDFVSSSNGTRLLWMPKIKRAALNSYQSGNWQWTDAKNPRDAIRRYHNDDMTD